MTGSRTLRLISSAVTIKDCFGLNNGVSYDKISTVFFVKESELFCIFSEEMKEIESICSEIKPV